MTGKILAFDQAIRSTGYCAMNIETRKIETYGTLINTSISKNIMTLIRNMKDLMIEKVDEISPSLLFLENIQMQRNAKTYKHLAWLQGAIMFDDLIYENGYFLLSPAEWRKGLEIKGRKRIDQKKNAQKYVKETYQLDVCEDEADAICIARFASDIIKYGGNL